MKLYSEKRSDLEEQQLHLNVGLNKIAETVEQVEEMQKSLAVKSQELQAKNEAANAKLKQMFKDQQEAEKKKIQSQEIQVKLADQTVKIEEKRKFVMADLAQVEPAVLDAQQGNSLNLYYSHLLIFFTETFLVTKDQFIFYVMTTYLRILPFSVRCVF